MGWIVLGLWAGCTWSDPASKQPTEAVPHFDEWERLVASVAAGDTLIASTVARDLTAAAEHDSSALGSALGFLQMAAPDELPAGLAAAAVACRACHEEKGASAPDAPARGHAETGAALFHSTIWASPPPKLKGDVKRAWDAATTPEGQLEGAISACQGCHVGPAVVGSDRLKQWCEQPCMGDAALWRAPGGSVSRVVLQGDLMQCSHVNTTWMDLDGTVRFSASDRPVGSVEEAAVNRATIDGLMAGLILATRLDCPE